MTIAGSPKLNLPLRSIEVAQADIRDRAQREGAGCGDSSAIAGESRAGEQLSNSGRAEAPRHLTELIGRDAGPLLHPALGSPATNCTRCGDAVEFGNDMAGCRDPLCPLNFCD